MNNRKNTWIYNLSNHRAQRCAPLAQGALETTAELNVTAHRTKPAFAANSEPMGEFHTVLYLPVRRHTYRIAERRQLDSRTEIISGILKNTL